MTIYQRDFGGSGGGSADLSTITALDPSDAITAPAAGTVSLVARRLGGYDILYAVQSDGTLGAMLPGAGVVRLRGALAANGTSPTLAIQGAGTFQNFTGAGGISDGITVQEGDLGAADLSGQIYGARFQGNGAAGFATNTFTPGQAETFSREHNLWLSITWAWPLTDTGHESLVGLSSEIVSPPDSGSSMIGVSFNAGDSASAMALDRRGSTDVAVTSVALAGQRDSGAVYQMFLGWRAGVDAITVSLYRADTETWLLEEQTYTTNLPDEAMGIQIATNSNNGAVASAIIVAFDGFILLPQG